mmetsp:Transcript_14463/g.56868  ORF Transcript_14463/g.56868 Transcript_14463/m.56868 type:complete len:222 (-) Transcript_14463:630-1295(-)
MCRTSMRTVAAAPSSTRPRGTVTSHRTCHQPPRSHCSRPTLRQTGTAVVSSIARRNAPEGRVARRPRTKSAAGDSWRASSSSSSSLSRAAASVPCSRSVPKPTHRPVVRLSTITSATPTSTEIMSGSSRAATGFSSLAPPLSLSLRESFTAMENAPTESENMLWLEARPRPVVNACSSTARGVAPRFSTCSSMYWKAVTTADVKQVTTRKTPSTPAATSQP